jgi:hypothetical protein
MIFMEKAGFELSNPDVCVREGPYENDAVWIRL